MFSARFKWQWLGCLVMALMFVSPAFSAVSVARMQTSSGVIDIQLYNTLTPLTVANFLKYAKSGAYNSSFIHRSVPGFIIQGGGYTWTTSVKTVVKNAPVKNEYSKTRSNLRGTIAMAKIGGDPNSATSEWFFNLADNSTNLDNQNGGFTVFGKVIGNGMKAVDSIAALPTANAGGAFSNLPYMPPVVNNSLQKSNMALVSQISWSAPTTTSDADRVFAYLEGLYPTRFGPANSLTPAVGVSKTASGYYYRYYATTKRYLGLSNGIVYWGSGFKTLASIGTLTDLLAKAAKLGY